MPQMPARQLYLQSKHDVAYSLFPAVHFRVVMFTAGCTALSVDTAQRFLLVTFICDRVDGKRATTE